MRRVVWGTALYSYLVTRHTGRAVRLSIESQIAECDGQVVAVLDFENVVVIDFSCADEVVAKLALLAVVQDCTADLFILFRGVDEHHLDPIESALGRRAVAVSAERSSGEPFLLGPMDDHVERAWSAACALGRSTPGGVAERLGLSEAETGVLLEDLHARRLLVRDDDASEYVSLQQLIREVEPPRLDQ